MDLRQGTATRGLKPSSSVLRRTKVLITWTLGETRGEAGAAAAEAVLLRNVIRRMGSPS